MISSNILADSINPVGARLTTFLLTYPRFIHSEFMTHRAFSRNAASSRAIPIEKMMSALRDNPALPEHYGSNRAGMQAGEPLDREEESMTRSFIESLGIQALDAVARMSKTGLHKQVANRYLEPWAHITVIATAADRGLANFFALRAQAMAQPEFQVLAFRMLANYLASEPRRTPWDCWHLPYGPEDRLISGSPEKNREVLMAAVGRCARVSYNRHDETDAERNCELAERLAAAGHWSPFEHVAYAWTHRGEKSNFDVGYLQGAGWRQFRKSFPGENQTVVDLPALMAAKPEWVTL